MSDTGSDILDALTSDDIIGRATQHPNPLFNFLDGYVPRKLKDMLRVQEWLIFNSPHIYAALNKLSDYSITDITYDTEASTEKKQMKELMEDSLKIKSVLKACSRDRMIYGNAFVSIYLPFLRFMKCHECDRKYNITKVEYKFKWKGMLFNWHCTGCGAPNFTSVDDLEDRRHPNPKRINVIRWDPKLMDIEYNPITGESVYMYTVPRELKSKIQSGNKHLLNTMPVGFLKAIKDNYTFKFEADQIFHMKVDAPAGLDAQWGMPPLMPTVKQFYYTAVLRKANEAIALDYVVPFRVLHPAQSMANNEPVSMINLANWRDETKDSIRRWRRDPLHIMFAPVPLGVTEMGGNGRALMVSQEIQDAENNILAGMGIPREFLFGGLSYTGSSVTLRMLENQLLNQTKDLLDLANWIARKSTAYLNRTCVPIEMIPFKLIDDVQQKSVLLNLAADGTTLSKTTLANVFGYDLEKERKQRMQESLDEIRFQSDLSREIQQMQNTLSQQARNKAQQGSASLQYDQQQIISAASNLVQQFMNLDPGTRRSQMHALQTEDAVMYSVVKMLMEQAQQQQATESRQQVSGSDDVGTTDSLTQG